MPDEPNSGGAETGRPTPERSSWAPNPAEPPGPGTPTDPTAQGPWTHASNEPTHQGHEAHTQPGAISQPPYGQPPYGQGQPPYGQGHAPYGQGQPYPPAPYGPGQPPPGPGQYGQAPYGQPPYGQGQFGQAPYAQGQPPYGQGQPPPYGQGQPPPYGQGQAPYGQGQPPYGQGHYGQPAYGGYQAQPGGYGGPGSGPIHYGYNWPYVPPRPERTPEERRKRNRRLGGLAGLFVVFLGVGILIGALIAPANPTTVASGLVSNTMAATAQAGTYHYVDLATIGGLPDNISGDAGPNGGRQVITQRCADGTNVFDLRLVKGVVYFRGNGPAVLDQLGVPKANAHAEVDKWVKVTKGEKPYTSFADGITARSNISQLKTTIVPAKSSVQDRTTKVSGYLRLSKSKADGTAALLITTATSLPRSLTGVATLTGHRYTLAWTFSHFHEKLAVTAPAHPVAFTSLHAKTPSTSVCG